MIAGFYEKPGHFSVREVADPEIRDPDDVIVDVEIAGMCGTDLHIVSVPQLHPAKEGIVLGHEFVGRVAEVGPAVLGLRPGDRVIAGPNIWCGQCETCRRGLRKMCRNNRALGITTDGGFAQRVRAPARVLYPVPEGMRAQEAVFAEPLSCCMNGIRKLGPLLGSRVAVFGAGPIGQYFIRMFAHFGAGDVLVSEPMAHRREQAIRSGAGVTLDPTAGGVVEALRDHTGGGPDIVVDTVGSLLPDALSAVRPGGQVLVFGMDQTCTCGIRPFDIVRNEKTIHGCFVDNDQIPTCLDVIPALRLGELITHEVGLADIGVGFSALRDGSAIKALVDLSR